MGVNAIPSQHVTGNKELEKVAHMIVHSAVKIHRSLGPGLLESAYEQCLAHELTRAGLEVKRGIILPLIYAGQKIGAGYRVDLLVEDSVIVENKAVDQLLPVHEAQLLTYLKLKGCRLGFLLNWNVPLMKKGIKRMVLGL